VKYSEFIDTKKFKNQSFGFKPIWMPEFLYDFQQVLTTWALHTGRSALFEDCGLGKTPQSLVWAVNVFKKTSKPVLVVTPLAVSYQTQREGNKFGIEVHRNQKGIPKYPITVTNYERLYLFNPHDFGGIVCDESSILKNFEGKMRKFITEFSTSIQYRLLCTATPAPNDCMELGTSSEALGYMKYDRMLGTFFSHKGKTTSQWAIKGYAKNQFWQWVGTWARAMRKPSDMGFLDGKFALPDLKLIDSVIPSKVPPGKLFSCPAITLNDQRQERRLTLKARCERAASLVPKNRPCILWCHLNDEGNLLESLIPDAVQVAGKDSDETKEKKLIEFSTGDIRVLITKPRIGGFGMNWQHCSDVIYFPSHSYEQFYQCIRRCWRFGQTRDVKCHIVSSQRESRVVENMKEKEKKSSAMYKGIVKNMSKYQNEETDDNIRNSSIKVPTWLQ